MTNSNNMYGEARTPIERKRKTIPEIIEAYPDGVTIKHVKTTTTKYGDNVICHIAEDDGIYFFGGKILLECIEDLATKYPQGILGLNLNIRRDGGWKLQYDVKTGKQGQKYYVPFLMKT